MTFLPEIDVKSHSEEVWKTTWTVIKNVWWRFLKTIWSKNHCWLFKKKDLNIAIYAFVLHNDQIFRKIMHYNEILDTYDDRGPSHTQPHNKEDEDLEFVYGFICKYGSNGFCLFL